MIGWNGLDLLQIQIHNIIDICYCTVWSTKNTHYRLIDIYRFQVISLGIEASFQELTIYRKGERLSKMIGWLGLEDSCHVTREQMKAQRGYKSGLWAPTLVWISYAEEHCRECRKVKQISAISERGYTMCRGGRRATPGE